MTRATTQRVSLITALIAAAGLSWTALAQDKPVSPPQAEGALGGPKVDEIKVPGAGPGFGGAQATGRRERPLSAEDFGQALRAALGPEAPENVRATPEVMDKLKAIADEFRQQQRAYMEEHREELAKLRGMGFNAARAGRGGEKGPPPGVERRPGPGGPGAQEPMGEMPAADREALLQRAKELRDNAPKPDDAFKKAWTLLSPEQQQAVQAKLDERRERVNRREAEQYVQRRLRDQDNKGGPGPGPDARRPGGPRPGPDGRAGPRPDGPPRGPGGFDGGQRERFQRLLERMSPEEREQLLRRLEDRMRERGVEGRQRRQGPPPPPPDAVNPPPPDGR